MAGMAQSGHSATPPPGGGTPDRGAGGPSGDPSGDRWGSRRALEVLAIAFLFPAAVGVGYLGGRWLGGQWGHGSAGGFVGAVLGALAGFWQLYQFVRRLAPR